MSGPETQDHTEMPEEQIMTENPYDELNQVCYDLSAEMTASAQAEAEQSVQRAAQAVEGEPDAGGSEEKEEKPEPEVKEEEPEIKEEQEEQEKMDPELEAQLAKFDARPRAELIKLLSAPDKYDQDIVSMILYNPAQYNDARMFVMAAKVARMKKQPQIARAVQRTELPPMDQEALQAFEDLSRLETEIDSDKAKILVAAQKYLAGGELSRDASHSESLGHQVAIIQQQNPDASLEDCFGTMRYLAAAGRLNAATSTARSFNRLQ